MWLASRSLSGSNRRTPTKLANFKNPPDRDGRVAFFDLLEGGARKPGALGELLLGPFALYAPEADLLAEQSGRLTRIAGIDSVFGHRPNS